MSADHETMHDKSSIKFQVIISDRRVDDHGYRKDEVDSTHSTLPEADARCREIVFKELHSRLALGMSLALSHNTEANISVGTKIFPRCASIGRMTNF